ncbi:hypothetical protein [Algibacter pacificus]|uniref:hypothetical protein n=1 Tax=Algibacter pacificus TaxID=2599389 RepID=UPI0011CC3835|nr:hypothetical protein [Algibacter pacificus]
MFTTTRIILWSFQALAFIVAVLLWHKYKNTPQRGFLGFLAFVVFTEVAAVVCVSMCHIKSYWVYNMFTVISGSFYLYWFYQILSYKKLILAFGLLFFISIVLALFQERFFLGLWRIPLTTITVLVLICSTLYFSELLNSSRVITFKTEQQFWLVTGLLIFYLGFLPLQLLMPYIKIKGADYLFAIMLLNIIMYGFFTISFLCLRKK